MQVAYLPLRGMQPIPRLTLASQKHFEDEFAYLAYLFLYYSLSISIYHKVGYFSSLITEKGMQGMQMGKSSVFYGYS